MMLFLLQFNIFVTDPKTNQSFTTKVDLSEVSVKEFKLLPNENGEFKFYMEKSKVDIYQMFITTTNSSTS